MNDKNSLSWTENLGKMALYVKGKASTTYAVLCLGYGGSACACPLVPRSGRRAKGMSRERRDIFTARVKAILIRWDLRIRVV